MTISIFLVDVTMMELLKNRNIKMMMIIQVSRVLILFSSFWIQKWQERYILYHMRRECKVHRFTWAPYSTPTHPLEMVSVKLKVLCVMLKKPKINNFGFFHSLITGTRHPCNASKCHQGYGNLQ
jgi:hypothetical protein